MIVVFERKFLASMQGREGPSVVGFGGILQTVLDGLKVFFKNIVFSRRVFKISFFLFPLFLMFLNFLKIMYVPTSTSGGVSNFEYDVFLVYIITSIDVFVFVLASWSAFTSKFPTLASVREIAQMCSFELIYGFCIIVVISQAGSLCFRTLACSQGFVWFVLLLTPYSFLFFIATLAETHRIPVDTSESESELVAGYQTEHGGFNFSFFYWAEYGGLIVSSIIFSILFLGGWGVMLLVLNFDLILVLKTSLIISAALLVRCSSPRVRLKTAMGVVWTQLLPFSNAAIPFYMWISYIFDSTRITEYVFLRSREYVRWVGEYYYFGFGLWFKKLGSGRDLRRDSAATNVVSTRDVVTAKLFLNWLRAKRNGNSAVSDVIYPYDRNLVDSLTVGGVNSVLARDRQGIADSTLPLFNSHAPLWGSMYETFLSLFNKKEFTKWNIELPNRMQAIAMSRDVVDHSLSKQTEEKLRPVIYRHNLVTERLEDLIRRSKPPVLDLGDAKDADTIMKIMDEYEGSVREFEKRSIMNKAATDAEWEAARTDFVAALRDYATIVGRLGEMPSGLSLLAGLSLKHKPNQDLSELLESWVERQRLVEAAKKSHQSISGYWHSDLKDENWYHYIVNGPVLWGQSSQYDSYIAKLSYSEHVWLRVLGASLNNEHSMFGVNEELLQKNSVGSRDEVAAYVDADRWQNVPSVKQYREYVNRYRHGWFYEHGRDLSAPSMNDYWLD